MVFSRIRKYLALKRITNQGTNIIIKPPFHIDYDENIKIGNHVYINRGSRLNGHGGIKIGSNVVFGPEVFVWSADHHYDSDTYIPYDEKVIKKIIEIEDNVWIGAHAKILPGIKIEEGAIVAMGSVITKNVPKGAIVGGNPARILKYRDLEKYERLKNEGKYYLKHKYLGNLK
ncbi:acyltransferase [Bhargavaea massiliensis]|uniref:acyltransferase n=1 Tax=Bhargavaea massiliensis TaxID=2697500 RepID=UPI001BCE932F|nr:acyltransferase [Bhargavaea massiliensis]